MHSIEHAPPEHVQDTSSRLMTWSVQVKKNEKLIEQNYYVHDITAYRRIIGRLLYLVHTWPDISFSVQFLSQFVQAPTKPLVI